MRMTIVANKFLLDDYILNKELCQISGISSNNYRYWKGVEAIKYDTGRAVFLHKKTIQKKYLHVVENCTDLSGFVSASAFCSYLGIAASHLTKKNRSALYELFSIKEVCKVKFVSLRKFYEYLGLDYSTTIYIEKCRYFAPTPLEKKIRLTKEMCLGYY